MKNLKIGTWNIGNGYFDLSKNDKKVNSIVNLLIFGNLDILALQEVNPLMISKIEERLSFLKDSYTITTSTKKYLNPISNLRVENNIIISRILSSSVSVNTPLPSISKGFNLENYSKRNLVAQMFDVEDKKIIINVTHLGESDKELRKKQFDKIIEEIDLEKVFIDDIILMGNLNSKLDEIDMRYFIKRLSNYGLRVIKYPYSEKVKHIDSEPVDYIIVPNTWEVESISSYAGSIVSIDNSFPVVASVTKKIERKW